MPRRDEMKKHFLESWKAFLPFEKLCYCLGVLSSVTLVAVTAIYLYNRDWIPLDVLPVMLALVELFLAGADWRRHRGLAVMSLCVSVFLLAVAFIIAG